MRLLVLLTVCLACAPRAQVPARPVDADNEAAGGLTERDEERIYDAVLQRLQHETLQVTTLIQVVPILTLGTTAEGEDGWTIPRARLGLRSRFDNGFGLRLQEDFAQSPSLKDAYLWYQTPSDQVRVLVGKQTVPLSAERLTSSGSVDFVSRSRASSALGPDREIGASTRVQLLGEALSLRAGVFNAYFRRDTTGERLAQGDRGGALVVARLQSASLPTSGVRYAVGAAVGVETAATAADVVSPGRVIFSVDGRFQAGRFLLAAEALRGRVDTAGGVLAEPTTSDGYFLTAGVDLTQTQRALARLDVFDGDPWLILGHNVSFTRAVSLQSNLIVPLENGEPPQLRFNAQVAF